ncbi:MAG: hypothetical protein ABWY77_04985 [Acidimicrobiia bacterium]
MTRAGVAVAVVAVVAIASLGIGGAASALDGNATPTVDAAPASVAVVAASAPVNGKVAFVVTNGTERVVRITRVTALASQTDGGQVLKASTTAVAPAVLAPGEQAIGQAAFRARSLAADATFAWKVATKRVASGTTSSDPSRLTLGNFVLSPAAVGSVAQTLAFDATNSSTKTIAGPLTVNVVCLNEAGKPAVATTTKVDRAKVRAGATVPITVKFRELCPNYVVAARGASST